MSKTPITDEIIDRIMAAGYDGFAAISEANRIMSEFRDSEKDSITFGIMGANGKCVDAIEIRRRR